MTPFRLTITFDCDAENEQEARDIHAKWLIGDWRNPESRSFFTDADVDCEELEAKP